MESKPMDEQRRDALNNIRFRVWSGYHDPDEVIDIVLDEDDLESEDGGEAWLRRSVAREFRKKRAAERGWPAVTDCDRLERLFASLRSGRILVRDRCGLTIQDGLDVIDDLYTEAGGERSGLVGYCFYHLQDLEAALWGEAGLWLAFGCFPASPAGAVGVGRLVRAESERAGFAVEWDGSADSRLLFKGFRWQRRSPA
jgi:hypothetical protein